MNIRAALSAVLLGWLTATPLGAQGATPLRSCEVASSEFFYFPAGVFQSDWREDDGFSRRWYSEHLHAMHEPSLSCAAVERVEEYRFLWLRTFHAPISVRIFRSGLEHRLQATVLDGAGGYEPGRVVQTVTRQLSQYEWEMATSAIDELGFWDLTEQDAPQFDPETDELIIHADGAQWILEGRTSRYHIVDRWGGQDGVETVGLIFLRLANLSPQPIY